MKTSLKRLILSATLLGTAAVSTPAMADHDLTAGENFSSLSTAAPAAGVLKADTGVQILSNSQAGTTLNVLMRAAVYDPGVAGFLDFVYQITNLSTSNTHIDSLTFANFGGPTKTISDAWQTLGAFGVFGPGNEEADSANRSLDGKVLGVNFDGLGDVNSNTDVDFGNFLLTPGETSAVFIFRVQTDGFSNGTFTAQDGVTVTGAGFAPVPEPATWAMLIGGFGLVGGAMRRRNRIKVALA